MADFEAYREKVGLPILQAWGMTETSPLASVCGTKSTLSGLAEDALTEVRPTTLEWLTYHRRITV